MHFLSAFAPLLAEKLARQAPDFNRPLRRVRAEGGIRPSAEQAATAARRLERQTTPPAPAARPPAARPPAVQNIPARRDRWS